MPSHKRDVYDDEFNDQMPKKACIEQFPAMPFRFLDLPGDLRNAIYACCQTTVRLKREKKRGLKREKKRRPRRVWLSLTQTSKQIRDEFRLSRIHVTMADAKALVEVFLSPPQCVERRTTLIVDVPTGKGYAEKGYSMLCSICDLGHIELELQRRDGIISFPIKLSINPESIAMGTFFSGVRWPPEKHTICFHWERTSSPPPIPLGIDSTTN